MGDQNRNLLTRVVTAVLLFPIAVWVTWLGGLAFALLVALAAGIAALELVQMFEGKVERTGVVGIAGAAVLPLVAWAGGRPGAHLPAQWVAAGVGLSVVLLLVTMLAQQGPLERAPRSAAVAALAWAYAGVLPAMVVTLRVGFGWEWVILLFLVAWGNDTFAYFAGRFLGKHKLAERISPKKTWEGFYGGAAGSVLCALFVKLLFLPRVSVAAAVVVGLGAAVLGPLGDLAESMMKRAAGVKDSGRIIPGHGGLLDRIDAVLFAAPWLVACALWITR
jgi:phosphatidate cytidylyltransferase